MRRRFTRAIACARVLSATIAKGGGRPRLGDVRDGAAYLR
ncbi:hypothetical protein BH09MYX1_BH09MYX1_40760 [soil metagenome]